MKISVIIPAFNEEACIAEALKAVLAQDYRDFEVIVVDNASTDRTSQIACSFAGVKVISESRKGTMWACEAGRKAAQGEIIVRMDADCLPHKDWLSHGAAFFRDPRIVVVSGPYDFYDATRFFRRGALWIQGYLFACINSTAQAFHVKAGITMGGNTFMRARALEAIGGFDTSLIFYGDDTDVPKRMSAEGKVVFSPRIVMPTSARRYKKEGVIRVQSKYLYHFFKVAFGSKA